MDDKIRKSSNALDSIKQLLITLPEADESSNKCDNLLDNNEQSDKIIKQDMELKGKFAYHVIIITYGWLGFLIICFFTNGVVGCTYKQEFLSDSALISLITGTALSAVLGLISIILKYLFPKKN